MKLSKLVVALGLFAAANMASANLILFVADQKNERGVVRDLGDATEFFDNFVAAPTADDIGKNTSVSDATKEGAEAERFNSGRVVRASASVQDPSASRTWAPTGVFNDVFQIGTAQASDVADLMWFVVGQVDAHGMLTQPALLTTSGDPNAPVVNRAKDSADFTTWLAGALAALGGNSEAAFYGLNPQGDFEGTLGTSRYDISGDMGSESELALVLMQNASIQATSVNSIAPQITGLSFSLQPNFVLSLQAPVPLPAGVWLLASALAGLGVVRRRRA